MRFKYIFSCFIVFAISLFSSSLVGHAAVVDLLEGKTGIRGSTEFKNMTDGNRNTYDKIFSQNPIMFDLGEVYTVDKFTINETKGTGSENPATLHVKYYDSNKKVLADYRKFAITEKIGDVRYVSIQYDYLNPLSVYEFKVYGTSDKVTDVENLKAEADLNQITLSWNNPDTPKFTGVNIYRGKQQIGKLDKTKNSYVVKGLKEAEEYSFTVKAIDENGFETSGVTKKARTKMPVIPPPENVFLTPQSGKMVIVWNDVNSPYLKGYNVYIDGKKINDEPLTSSKMIVKNLENNKSYKVQISAVNKDDVEGEKSKEKSEKPSSNALEVEYDVKMPFTPMDFLKTSLSFLGLIGPFVLLALTIIYHKRLIEMIKKSLASYKERRKQ
ncbi:fibronectin type III domain-containing protein [Bacillus cereus]|uniref:fibronectin type III domain-containing protein n=1 Tax=Bacillus cereus TaxID=1396 RepID=UPI001D0E9D70|nr:fibronectin type III domain-containing protein [Bacillus cereus]MCC2370341.1 fibronectin type III domain-containing protein [Bacillus cereus]MCC2491383.1 fibronectin type III domain-containing protein [Bacillus cereus]MDF9457560.1 fibronectin type III domain-containing protein [Bacillus cereus]MDF9644943.1 fibronectin type III domain-containing protein [Bacillus cereus]